MPAEKPAQLDKKSAPESKALLAQVFDDPESRRKIVGLFDLLLKMDRRNHPELYDMSEKPEKPK